MTVYSSQRYYVNKIVKNNLELFQNRYLVPRVSRQGELCLAPKEKTIMQATTTAVNSVRMSNIAKTVAAYKKIALQKKSVSSYIFLCLGFVVD